MKIKIGWALTSNLFLILKLMVQKIAPYFLQWKIESGKWKIVLNNFQLSIIHFQFKKGRVQFFAPLTIYIEKS
ncbi:hypothetical protein EGQ24_00255 [bacterium]|nr:hypothetical protein [bacterium]